MTYRVGFLAKGRKTRRLKASVGSTARKQFIDLSKFKGQCKESSHSEIH
jgi:hypothetical protein